MTDDVLPEKGAPTMHRNLLAILLVVLALAGCRSIHVEAGFRAAAQDGPTTMPTPTPRELAVPNVVEMPLAEARRMLEERGLRVSVVPQTAIPGQTDETVVRQHPAAEASAREGDTVDLFVAKRPEPITVPPVVGRHRADAERLIQAAGLTVSVSEEHIDQGLPVGMVIRQEPPPATQVAPRSKVTIVVNLGPRPPTPTGDNP